MQTIPIYTLSLPAIIYGSRLDFLDVRQRLIIEPTLSNQELFLKNGANALHFHKDKQQNDFGCPLIHIFDLDGLFTMRAYGNEAAKTLMIWEQWVAHEHPFLLKSRVLSEEFFSLEQLDTIVTYSTTNWVPFSKCEKRDGYFYDAEKPTRDIENVLGKRLMGNLRTFLNNLGISDNGMQTYFSLQEYPQKNADYSALKSRGKSLYKKAFEIKVETNLRLPLIFSLGQNVGYGCGLFRRKF